MMNFNDTLRIVDMRSAVVDLVRSVKHRRTGIRNCLNSIVVHCIALHNYKNDYRIEMCVKNSVA